MIIIIQYISILTREGKSLLFRNYGVSEVDRELSRGLLREFSRIMNEINQNDIRNTNTDDFKYFYTIIDDIIIIVCADLSDDDAIINSKLTTIRAKFIEKYGELLSNRRRVTNRSIFREFEMELDNLILGAIKIAIIGFGGVGKIDLIHLICGKNVDLEYVPTITADIAEYDGDELGRTITLWDFAGQSQFRSLWRSLLEGTDIILLVTDSTYENINGSREIIHDILNNKFQDKLVIGIANKQNLPNRLTPELCERILSTEKRFIKVHGMVADNPLYREKILAILRDAIKKITKGVE